MSIKQRLYYKNISKNWWDLSVNYFLKSNNKHIFENIHFPTIETQQYAIDNWNFVESLLDVNYNPWVSNKEYPYWYIKFDTSLSINQGLGCGIVISKTLNLDIFCF